MSIRSLAFGTAALAFVTGAAEEATGYDFTPGFDGKAVISFMAPNSEAQTESNGCLNDDDCGLPNNPVDVEEVIRIINSMSSEQRQEMQNLMNNNQTVNVGGTKIPSFLARLMIGGATTANVSVDGDCGKERTFNILGLFAFGEGTSDMSNKERKALEEATQPFKDDALAALQEAYDAYTNGDEAARKVAIEKYNAAIEMAKLASDAAMIGTCSSVKSGYNVDLEEVRGQNNLKLSIVENGGCAERFSVAQQAGIIGGNVTRSQFCTPDPVIAAPVTKIEQTIKYDNGSDQYRSKYGTNTQHFCEHAVGDRGSVVVQGVTKKGIYIDHDHDGYGNNGPATNWKNFNGPVGTCPIISWK